MTEIDIVDGTSLFEKIMAHFGWYKAKKVDLQVEKMEANYTFIIKDDEYKANSSPEFTAYEPEPKKTMWAKDFKSEVVVKALNKQAPKPRRKRNGN